MMTPDQLRARYISFFEARDHRFVPSSPVIPESDPTLMFANAGMNQFKDLLLGNETRDYKRAVNAQKCVRAGGKHNDLDDVGKDARHLTFFEMLGNWSFGDYYKQEAIAWAWEFVTKELALDTDRLYVTVHHTDDESLKIWHEQMGVPMERILKLGDKDNFWAMGPTGPCGPCTEIHYDLSPELGEERFVPGYNDDRIVEIWNLVFMESNREEEDGPLLPLPLKSVDTGMGLDRVAMVMAGANSVFKTALFTPIFEQTAALLGQPIDDIKAFYARPDFANFAVIADHVRTCLFALCDGAKFSNEGRGYVLRRILRRAVRYGRELGFKGPFMHEVARAVIENYKNVYPELGTMGVEARALIKLEEESFFRTIDRGIALFNECADQVQASGQSVIPGDQVFMLHDTFGFPPDLTQIMAEERGLGVDLAGYETARGEQQARSRSKDMYADAAGVGDWITVSEGSADTFVGYELTESRAHVRKLRLLPGGAAEILLSQTPFYAESGGQVGDVGELVSDDGAIKLRVIDTQRAPIGIVHRVEVVAGELRADALHGELVARVDASQRALSMRHHTATHLLHAALRTMVSDSIFQAGSLVSPDKLRFDFSYSQPIPATQLRAMEDQINAQIRAAHPVTIHQGVDRERAVQEMGAMAIFGEKYGDVVRVVEIPGESVELCGGTHVANTADIGLFRIVSESGVAAGIRRIEALASAPAFAAYQEDRARLEQAARALKTSPHAVAERAQAVLDERAELERQLQRLQQRLATLEAAQIVTDAQEIQGVKVIAQRVQVEQREQLLAYADSLRDRMSVGVVLLGAELEGKAALICLVTEEAVKAHKLRAGDLINDVASHIGGRGGGRPTLAQAGGAEVAGLDEAIAAFASAVHARLS